jgi:hypothetical protein
MRPHFFVTACIFAAVLASPLAAQGGGMAGMNMDPTNKIVGSGKLPNGWMNRFDDATATLPQVEFVQMGSALHVRSGPAAIYYDARDAARGEYTVSGTFSQKKTMQHEAYGLFVGGGNLQDPTQHYLYFVVRPIDGSILISHRANNGPPTALVAMTPDEAVHKDDPATGAATNVLAIHVGKDSVHFYANGKQVRAFVKSAVDGAATEGQFGLRINHNLDITVEGFGIKK